MVVKPKSAGGLRKQVTPFKIGKAAIYFAAFFLLGVFSLTSGSNAQSGAPWEVGRFSFSDELGGFRILGVSGTGTQRDPYYIRQVFTSAASATLVIRTRDLGKVAKLPNNNITHSSIHVQIETLNNSNLPWVGFGFELQEKKDKASTYGDGLSFDQLARRSKNIVSDRFQSFEDEFEPGDRLVYNDGFVNDQMSVTTKFVITDFTPVEKFFLFQDPMVPAS